jgi:hypothetical protein
MRVVGYAAALVLIGATVARLCIDPQQMDEPVAFRQEPVLQTRNNGTREPPPDFYAWCAAQDGAPAAAAPAHMHTCPPVRCRSQPTTARGCRVPPALVALQNHPIHRPAGCAMTTARAPMS